MGRGWAFRAALLFALVASCSRRGASPAAPPSPAEITAPSLLEAPIRARLEDAKWGRYLAYGKLPEAALELGTCSRRFAFPPMHDPILTESRDYGYGTTRQVYYYGLYTATTLGCTSCTGSTGSGNFQTYGTTNLTNNDANTRGTSAGSGEVPRSVVEPDLYAWDGKEFLTVNSYKGLQAVDVSDPRRPVYSGGEAVAGFPDELYLKNGLAIVLSEGFASVLDLWGGGYGFPATPPAVEEARIRAHLSGQIATIDVSDPASPRLVEALPLDGDLIESRVVGDVLYAVTFTRGAALVSSYDLSGAPKVRRVAGISMDLGGGGWSALAYVHLNVSSRLLFVSVPLPCSDINNQGVVSWTCSTAVHIIDISDPGGAIVDRGTIQTAGVLGDRFKMDLDGNVFRVISSGLPSSMGNWLSQYDLSDPAHPALLSTLAVGAGERLYATRFDGPKAYIVTFRAIDPLWIVDLSDPRHPRVAGEVRVPGWSQFLEPLGDRLVAFGVDNSSWFSRKAAISLFDVADPAHPALLKQVSVGERWSTSYGFGDFKAFQVLPDPGLILMPYTDYGGFWYWGFRLEDKVAVVSMTHDDLEPASEIPHVGTIERPLLRDGLAYLLSQKALQIADLSTPTAPASLSLVRLLRPVSRIRRVGAFLLAEEEEGWWEVLRTDSDDYVPAARLKVGEGGELFPVDPRSFVVVRNSGVPHYGAGGAVTTEVFRVTLTDQGVPEAQGCFAFPDGVWFFPGALVPLAGDRAALPGRVGASWGGSSTAPIPYGSGALYLLLNAAGGPEPTGWLRAPSAYISTMLPYYAPYSWWWQFPSGLFLRGTRLWHPYLESEVFPLDQTSGSTISTDRWWAGRVDLATGTWDRINLPGSLAYVSEDETRLYEVENAGGTYGYGYSAASTETIRGFSLDAQGLHAAGALQGVPAYAPLTFSDDELAYVSGGGTWFNESPQGATVTIASLVPIAAPVVTSTVALPAQLSLGAHVAGLSDERLVVAAGWFFNPRRIREAAISNDTWWPTQWETAQMGLVYDRTSGGPVLEHVFPTTADPRPLTVGSTLVVPTGMYGFDYTTR